jgi:hypothetical protein
VVCVTPDQGGLLSISEFGVTRSFAWWLRAALLVYSLGLSRRAQVIDAGFTVDAATVFRVLNNQGGEMKPVHPSFVRAGATNLTAVRPRTVVEVALERYLPAGRSSAELDTVGCDPAFAELEWRRMLIADAYEAYLLACEESELECTEVGALLHVVTRTGEDLEFVFEVIDSCHS